MHHTPDVLKRILRVHTQRKLSKNLEFSLNKNIYQIITPGKGYRLRHSNVTICEHIDGSKEVIVGTQKLEFRILDETLKGPPIVDTKGLNPLMDKMVKNLTQEDRVTNRVNHRAHSPCPPAVRAREGCGLVDNAALR